MAEQRLGYGEYDGVETFWRATDAPKTFRSKTLWMSKTLIGFARILLLIGDYRIPSAGLSLMTLSALETP